MALKRETERGPCLTALTASIFCARIRKTPSLLSKPARGTLVVPKEAVGADNDRNKPSLSKRTLATGEQKEGSMHSGAEAAFYNWDSHFSAPHALWLAWQRGNDAQVVL